MLTFTATDEQAAWAWQHTPRERYGRGRDNFAGDHVKRYAGLLAEVIIADAIGLERRAPEGDDGGMDLEWANLRVDIKATVRNTPPRPEWPSNLRAAQALRAGTHAFIFCALHREARALTVMGFLEKRDLQHGWYCKRGEKRTRTDGTRFTCHEDMYEVPTAAMTPIGTIQDLTRELTAAARRPFPASTEDRKRGADGADHLQTDAGPDHG